LLTELLDVLGVDRERLVKREYVNFKVREKGPLAASL
jgi:hypothetical protein